LETKSPALRRISEASKMMTDLKILRKMTDLTQYELAQKSGVARWKLSLIEAQQVEPSLAEEAALRGALEKSLKNLAGKAAEVARELSRHALAV
jgi:DNA-binding XRE family transcriptional regulator